MHDYDRDLHAIKLREAAMRETPQTGLLRRAKSTLNQWSIDDLDGFARPADMPFKIYWKLRNLKQYHFRRRAMPVNIWSSEGPINNPNNQRTYRRAVHGPIGSRNKTL